MWKWQVGQLSEMSGLTIQIPSPRSKPLRIGRRDGLAYALRLDVASALCVPLSAVAVDALRSTSDGLTQAAILSPSNRPRVHRIMSIHRPTLLCPKLRAKDARHPFCFS